MTNKAIAQKFKLLAALLEIHDQDIFKIRSYQKGARIIEKWPEELAGLDADALFAIPGIGKAIGNKSIELLEKGTFDVLDEWLSKTPPGIVEMVDIKGLGPKKIATIWQEMSIENVGELLYACMENRLQRFKGLGEKTQESIRQAIVFYMDHQGQYLYAQAEPIALKLDATWAELLPDNRFALSGDFKRQVTVIDKLTWVTDATKEQLTVLEQASGLAKLDQKPITDVMDSEGADQLVIYKTETGLPLHFVLSSPARFTETLFKYNCQEDFYTAFVADCPEAFKSHPASEEAVFQKLKMAPIPTFLREDPKWIKQAADYQLPDIIQVKDVKGVIHAHSKYSDGAHTLAEMAMGAKTMGYEYLVISDHSQSAVYANGLKPVDILRQHQEIDELNQSLAPFKIFKSIESDILRNGDLDYNEEILQSFDLVIASVHSGLKMTEQDATQRLLKAIGNKYTRILGHMTGRLLLSRQGYPLDLERILDACSEHQVVIELNANPRRLDMDWSYIDQALARNIMISIDPDAHSIKGIEDIRYGVLAAQKAGLTSAQNLSSYSLQEMEAFIAALKQG